jgi:omega-6 fatty acid desaturase (delta-12 desaturase)
MLKYQTPTYGRTALAFVSSIVPLVLTWYAAYRALEVSYALTLAIGVVCTGFFVRMDMLQHDAGHGSLFKEQLYNDILGTFCSFFSLMPYYQWRASHATHHATTGNLDKRGIGDVWTMTVKEYAAADSMTRFRYRLFRNPIILFVIGGPFLFMVWNRFVINADRAKRRERLSTYGTNLGILVLCLGASYLVGWKAFLMVQLPISMLNSAIGTWLFYMQHQFETTYWKPQAEWDFFNGALRSSSHYKLPRLLQWFSACIGIHHIHHLNSRIPFYNLEACHNENAMFQGVATEIGLFESLHLANLRVWDEDSQRLLTWRQAAPLIRAAEAQTQGMVPSEGQAA